MSEARTILLNDKQIEQRINRIAYQIFEDNAMEKEIILAGIVKNGFQLCEKIASVIRGISQLNIVMDGKHIVIVQVKIQIHKFQRTHI